jgi:hypothetical protein
MLNINDIKERYRLNPEPEEVTKARELITKSFSKLEFVEETHQYFLPGRGGKKKELPSVSSVIERWVPYVDWDEQAEIKAVKLGMTKEALLKEWHENKIRSTSCGSKTHWFGENAMNMFIGREDLTKANMPFQYTEDGYLIPYCGKENAVTRYYEDILANPNVYPVMPEAKIYTNMNKKFKLKLPYAGTFDILLAYHYKGRIVFSIHDFKTNKDIYKDYSRAKKIMMLEPFASMGFFEEAYSHYCIQLSMYQIGLMQLGLEIADRNLIWLKEDGTYEKVKTPDLTETILTELS